MLKKSFKLKHLKKAVKKVMDLNKTFGIVNLSQFSASISSSFCNSVESFQSFALASVDPNSEVSNYVQDWGNNDLCPIVLRSSAASFRCKFPEINNCINEKELVPFCFPHGLEVRIIPKCAVEEARRLGWIGSLADEHQLHAVRLIVAFVFSGV